MRSTVAALAIVFGGAAVGVAVERAGVLSPVGEPTAVAGLFEVEFSPCPGLDSLGSFHGGDRVFVTGRTDSSDWLEVRAPFDVATRVWIEASYATSDSDVSVLPVVECALGLSVAAPSATSTSSTSTTSASSTSTTFTSSTTTTTTTLPAPTTTETTQPPPPPTDTDGPTIAVFQADEDELWEDATPCAAQPRTMLVGGFVEDPSGVDSVWIDWSVASESGTTPALLVNPDFPGFFFAEVGPFPTSTLDSGSAPIWLQMTAYDASPAHNESIVTSTSFTVLTNCTVG